MSPRRWRASIWALIQGARLKGALSAKTERCLIGQEWMQPFFLFALLPGSQDQRAGIIGQHHCATLHWPEICSLLAAGEQRQNQATDKRRPQLFHQVERQTGPAGAVAVQKADRRAQPYRLILEAAPLGILSFQCRTGGANVSGWLRSSREHPRQRVRLVGV